ncbi:MAG: type II toxin-antitoxin system RelE/ParE family toxin [Chloroflexaceae bacterium]|jgi:toxin ParE1/3/4|nr:type II toxin-antitoxin system RelE/ParE family toxin [Chloroflexaceae bacterium]
MQVELAIQARDELRRYIAYVAERNPQAAQQQYDLVLRALRLLEATPRVGRPGRVQDTRELVIQRTPLLAIYEVTNRVTILHIVHHAQQWPPSETDEEA